MFDGYSNLNNAVINEINRHNLDILFVGLGLKLQEKFILKYHNELNARIILSVGGWFKYLSKEKKKKIKKELAFLSKDKQIEYLDEFKQL